MLYEITTNTTSINWQAKGQERTLQNVINLLNTFRYEVAYDRTLGLDRDVDGPIDEVAAQKTNEIIELIEENEPNAVVKRVEFVGIDDDGNMAFKVVVDIE